MEPTKPTGGAITTPIPTAILKNDKPAFVPPPLASFCLTFAKDAQNVLTVNTNSNRMGIEINNGVSKDFRLRHSLDLKNSTYGFMSMLQREQTMLRGMANTSGWFTAKMKHNWSDNMTTTLNSEFDCLRSISHTALDMTYKLGQGVGKILVEKQNGESFVATGDVTYRIAEGVTLGGQLQYDRQQAKANGKKKAIAAAMAIQHDNPLFTGTCGVTTQGIVSGHIARRVCHYNKPGEDNVKLATGITFDLKKKTSAVKVGAQFLLPHTKSQVHLSVEGSGKLCVDVRERLADWMMLQLTSEVDHNTCDYMFGIGIQIGPAVAPQPNEFTPLQVPRWEGKRVPARYNA